MQPPKKYLIVKAGQEGANGLFPMKEWCRQNPTEAPPMNPNEANSQQLRKGFARMGWVIEETETQVLILHPGTPQTALKDLENEELEQEGDETPDDARGSVFELEWQLRDFIAHNIESLSVDGKSLRLYVDDQGRDGVEYPTGVGPIDILAIDSDGAYGPDKPVHGLADYEQGRRNEGEGSHCRKGH